MANAICKYFLATLIVIASVFVQGSKKTWMDARSGALWRK